MTADDVVAGDILTLVAELRHDSGLEDDLRSEFAVTVTEAGSIASLLSVEITATPNPVASNGNLAYTISITNGYGVQVDDVSVQLRVPVELFFHGATDAEPDVVGSGGCHSGTFCSATEEALWELGTLTAGENRVITINTTVEDAINDGNLIIAPVRVTATGMEDTINFQHTAVIDN